MTIGSHRGSGQERWVRQENERREVAFQVSLARWRRQDAELRSLLAAAATRPAREGDWSEWLEPAEDEAVYWTASGAGLIEAPYVLKLRPPHRREFSRAEEPPAGPPVDTGQVAVTDRRVVFAGGTRREWPYATLIGMAHTAAGETWLLVTSARNVSGVAAPELPEFRLYLALALADRAGERDAFVADLAEQVERHQQTKPLPPPPATAGEAPPQSPLWSRRRQLQTAAAISAALASLLAVTAALAGGDDRPDSFSASTESPPVSSPPSVAAPESPAPGGQSPQPGAQSPEPPRDQSLRQANAPQQLPPPPPPPATSSPPATPSPDPTPSPPTDTLDPRFSDCDEANENGFGPYFRDQDPEYWWYRDRNGDGVVCRP